MVREELQIDLLIHDMKTPLAVIQTGLDALVARQELYGPLTDKQAKVLRRLLRNTRAARLMIEDVLELGRAKEGLVRCDDVPVFRLVRNVLVDLFDLTDSETSDAIRHAEGCPALLDAVRSKGLDVLMPEALWEQTLPLDESKTAQILRNLLSNALKYRKSSVILKIDVSSEAITVSVKDDGEGIPAKFHEQIFDRYFQIDPEARETIDTVRGHGVGLAGVLLLVRDLGGRMTLDSDAGRGAEFIVRLPLRQAL